jgi:hypothetical protein
MKARPAAAADSRVVVPAEGAKKVFRFCKLFVQINEQKFSFRRI